ncbi:unnamed protein product [Sympodiomycopsis kandeliae]
MRTPTDWSGTTSDAAGPRLTLSSRSQELARASLLQRNPNKRMRLTQDSQGRHTPAPSPSCSAPRQTDLTQFFSSKGTQTKPPKVASPTETHSSHPRRQRPRSDVSHSTVSRNDRSSNVADEVQDLATPPPVRSPSPPPASTTFRSLGTAPTSTLRPSHRNPSQSTVPPKPLLLPSPRRHAVEEEQWLQRAQALAGRSRHRKPDEPVVEEVFVRSGRNDQLSTSSRSTTISKSPPTSHTPRSPGPHIPLTSDTTPPTSPPHAATSSPSHVPPPESEETPWMHESLSGLSLLPWEMDAALKAADYRISAGLEPTKKDLEAKEKLQLELAKRAHQQALQRTYGGGDKEHQQPRIEPGRKPRPVPAANNSAAVINKPAVSGPQPSKHDDVSRMEQPHKANEQAADKEGRIQPPRQYIDHSDIPIEKETTREVLTPRVPPNQLPEHQHQASSRKKSEKRDHNTFKPLFVTPPASPSRKANRENLTPDQPSERRVYALRDGPKMTGTEDANLTPMQKSVMHSPRTKRKIYALETQGLTTSPTPSPSTSTSNTPRKSRLKDVLLSKHASPSKRQRLEIMRKMQHSPPSSSSEEIIAPSSETQPLDSDYDDDFSDDNDQDTTMLAPGPRGQQKQKSISPEPEVSRPDPEETQPLPFDDNHDQETQPLPFDDDDDDGGETQVLPFPAGESETEEEEEEIHIRPLSHRKHTQFTKVNDAWKGICHIETPKTVMQPRHKQSQRQEDETRQGNLNQFDFHGGSSCSSAKRKKSASATFFTLDAKDLLSDDDDEGHEDGEETQVLPWPTQSSHTEDDEAEPMIRRASNGSSSGNSSWIPSSQGLHGVEHGQVREFLKGL